MSSGTFGADRGLEWHRAVAPGWKLVKSLPMGAPSQDRDAGSNPAGATKLSSSRLSAKGSALHPEENLVCQNSNWC